MDAPINEFETPLVTVDLDVVKHNIEAAQHYFNQHNLALRTHIKTHKIPELTRMQLQAGASGICCQKLGEAEIMIDEAGAKDIFIPFNLIGLKKAQHLAELAARPEVVITVGADSLEAARSAQIAGELSGKAIRVMIECDTGGKRAGLPTPQQVLELALEIKREFDMVELAGLFTFPTNLTQTPAFFAEADNLLKAKGIQLKEFSGGGTPIQWKVGGLPIITEHRTGTYIYNDRNTLGANACTLEDCAMRVICTVVSRPTPDRAIIDGGSKTFSSDPWLTGPTEAKYSFGLVKEYPEALFSSASEEHGILDLTHCQKRPEIGETISVIPNHCCTTTNMHDLIYGVRGGRVEQIFKVAARGKIW